MEKADKIQFSIQDIKIEQFAIFEDKYNSNQNDNIELRTQLQFKINATDKRIGAFLGFEFLQKDDVFIKILVSCHFLISDDSWNGIIGTKTPKAYISQEFLYRLLRMTIGTTRGILFAKTENTPFSKFIIPSLDLKEMVPKRMEFQKSKK